MSSNPEVDNLMALLHKAMYRAVEETFGQFVTKDGKLALRTAPIQGPLPTKGGGTGNTQGFKDHSHAGGTQGQQLAEANTHESLNTDPATMIHWTREQLQDMLATFIVDDDGSPFTYNDLDGTLAIPSGEGNAWGVLTDGTGGPDSIVFDSFGQVVMVEFPR